MRDVKGKISVVMGVYNCEATIKESIESVLNQTYKNLELIICDDGSKDKTIEIIEKIKNSDDRLKLLKNKENKGLAYSLNKCIKKASGEFIARHDGDDICMLDRFEKQMAFIKKNNLDFIGSAVEYFDENGVWGRHFTKANPTILDTFKESNFCHPTIVVKKRILEEVECYTVSKITYRTEDYDLFVKIYRAGYKGVNMNECLVKMRRDDSAYSRRKFKYRVDESRCKYKAYKLVKPGIKYFPVCIAPVIKGFIPSFVFKAYHNIKFQKRA